MPKKKRVNIYPLPGIFPIVLYNGKKQWRYPTKLYNIETPPGVTKYTPQFEFELVDLSQFTEQDLDEYKEWEHLYHCLKLLKHAQKGEVVQTLLSMVEYLQLIHETIPELSETYLLLAICVVDNNKNENFSKPSFTLLSLYSFLIFSLILLCNIHSFCKNLYEAIIP